MKHRGFTLAEVLITLMIIGIVAALTIPSVISNYQQQEFKTGLKKAVSVLNEAIQTNIAQDGETPYDNWSIYDYLQRHMSILKTSNLSTCFNSETGDLVKLNEDQIGCGSANADYYNNYVFYTTDGMRFEVPNKLKEPSHFYLHETGLDAMSEKKNIIIPPWSSRPELVTVHEGFCGSYGLNNNANNITNTPCVVMVDVNGDKKPNPPHAFDTSRKSGFMANQSFEYTYPSPSDKKFQDIFPIMITDEKAIPFGVVAQRAMYSK